jgi:alpha-N-arabinofuranosidase
MLGIRAIVLSVLSAAALAASGVWTPSVPNILSDPSFEQYPLTNGWAIENSVFAEGTGGQSVHGVHSGQYSLRLDPNGANPAGDSGIFGIGQKIPPTQYIGQPLYFGVWTMATGNVTAVTRLSAISSTGAVYWRELRQASGGSVPVLREDVLDIPNDPTIVALVITCSVSSSGGSAFFDDIVVSTQVPTSFPEALGTPDPGPDLQAAVNVDASQVIRTIPRTLYGSNLEWIWNGDGVWNADTQTLDSTLIDLAKQGGVSLLRFPGGFFSDYYNWQNGIGPLSQRPSTPILPNSSLSANNFGTDEALAYASIVGGNLIITVNVQTGTAQEAADWVRYVNNGQRYVQYWEIGNEPYVNPQVFSPNLQPLTPAAYAQTFLEYAQAMKAVDPTIKLGASFDVNYGMTTFVPFPDWNATLLSMAGSQIGFIAVHNAFAPVLPFDGDWNARMVYGSMLGTSTLIQNSFQSLEQQIDQLTGSSAPNIALGVTEWGPLFSTDPLNGFIDHTKTLGSALYAATVLRVLVSDTRTALANEFKLVDTEVQGWIGPRNGQNIPKAPLYALEMFSKHFGTQLIPSTVQSPTYESRSIGWVDGQPAVPYLESVSSLNDNGSQLTVLMINKHFDRAIQTTVQLGSFCPTADAIVWTLAGTALDANTGTQIVAPGVTYAPQITVVPDGRFNQGAPDEVTLSSSPLAKPAATFTYEVPARSVVSIVIPGGPTCTASTPASPSARHHPTTHAH